MSRLIGEIVARMERDFPPRHRDGWTVHTTSEAKAEDDHVYLLEVIGKLYERIDAAARGDR